MIRDTTVPTTARPAADAPAPASPPPAAGPCYVLRCLLLLAAVTLLVHGLSLWDGVILDDFWHQKGLREHGWSFPELMRTLVIAPADFLDTWWQTRDVRWHYLRPFFIVCMKTVYTILGRNDPAFLHAFSILLHLAGVLMVWRLCWRLTHHPAWSFIGGLMFAIYPHSIITVAWPSSQNVVIQNTLLVAMLLVYLRASGLSVGPETWSAGRPAARPVPAVSRLPLALTVVLWFLAILTRENAVLMPAILASFDLAFGGRRHLRARWRFYAFCAVVAAAFAAWREAMHIPPLPDVYCRRPDGDLAEYLPWLAAKFLHYLCASVWPAPLTIGPTGRFNPWTEVPGDCLLMLVLVGLVAAAYVRAARAAPGFWIWPLWIALSILPVAAVVATPHSGYMAGLGFAVGLALAGAASAARPRRARPLATALAAFLILGMAFMSPVSRLQWLAIRSAEHLTPDWVLASPPPPQTRDVFFINLPFVNIYLKPNLVQRLGPWFERVNVHVLTWSPDGLAVTQRTIVEQLDDRRFTVAIEGRPYFSGAVGRFVLEAFRGRELFTTGQFVAGRHVAVRILEADPDGVRKLQFTFPRPLTDPSYCFYLVTGPCGAARLRFPDAPKEKGVRMIIASAPAEEKGVRMIFQPPSPDPSVGPMDLEECGTLLAAGHARAALPLFEAAMADDPALAKQADMALRPVVTYMLHVLGSPLQPLLDDWRLEPPDWQRIRDFWTRTVDDRALADTWLRRRDFDHLVWLRAEIDWDRWLASFLLRTDLYLTGPPFPGPRGSHQAPPCPTFCMNETNRETCRLLEAPFHGASPPKAGLRPAL